MTTRQIVNHNPENILTDFFCQILFILFIYFLQM